MPSTFDLSASLARATERLGQRKRRADLGASRLPPLLDRHLQSLLRTHERPRMRDVHRELIEVAASARLRAPSRATLYNAINRCRPRSYRVSDLPTAVQESLYNVDPVAVLDGAQVAFYAFNHGDLRAACWAAGMPWLALHHAARMRGWRPKSRGLLVAAMHQRRIA